MIEGEDSFFRKEVFEHKKNHNLGSILLNTPFRYRVATLGFSIIALLILFFVFFAQFSEKFTVNGFLNSTKPVTRIYPKVQGIITKSYYTQGDEVKKGDKLFVIDTSSGLYSKKEQAFLWVLKEEKKNIRQRIRYKSEQLASLKELVSRGYLSLLEYNKQQDELVELIARKQAVNKEMIKYQQNTSYIIYSPINGVISSVIYKKNEYTHVDKPLIKIMPKNARLLAELFIPARKAGFIDQDSIVFIKYDAYPSENFGAFKARIRDISQSILTDEEEEKPITIGEPYYKVSATLDSQHVMLYGKEKQLKHGMTLSAVIAGEKKTIFQWMLNPYRKGYGL